MHWKIWKISTTEEKIKQRKACIQSGKLQFRGKTLNNWDPQEAWISDLRLCKLRVPKQKNKKNILYENLKSIER